MAWFDLEHLGETSNFRDDHRMATLAAVIVNSRYGQKQTHEPSEFMPHFVREEADPGRALFESMGKVATRRTKPKPTDEGADSGNLEKPLRRSRLGPKRL